MLSRELGRGGIGRVWLAREKRLERDVAVKLLLDLDGHEGDEDRWKAGELLSRFAVEARAIAGLDHPGIPAVYDWSSGDAETGDPPYLAMQYIRGKNLRNVLEEEVGGRLTLAEGVCLGAQLSSILAAVHDAGEGIVHRDLKPSNIMVTEAGRVSLIDFGSAFIVARHRPRVTTRSRMAPATSGYTAPEVLRARSGPAALSDLYALGCVLYEVFGGPVFDYQSDSELDAAHLNEIPHPLRKRNPDVPEELDRLVMQLLEKDPKRRPEGAREVFARLRPFLPAAPRSRERQFKRYDLTLPFLDPCRPPEGKTVGKGRRGAVPPLTVTTAKVDPAAFIEDLRRVRDLALTGQREDARKLADQMVSALEEAQGAAGTDVRRALSSSIQIFLEVHDVEHAKMLWSDLLRRAQKNGVGPRDRFIGEAEKALRDYEKTSSEG